MQFRRYNGVKWLILSIVTCGIYSIIVWVKMTNDHNKMAQALGGKKVMGFIPAILLGIITCDIYTIIWLVKFYSQFAFINKESGANVAPQNGFLMFLMSCIPVYSYIWMANTHNAIADSIEAMMANNSATIGEANTL